VTFNQTSQCSLTVSTNTISVASTGGSSSVMVTVGPACAWTATTNASSIHITSGASGTGPGTIGLGIDYTVSTSARSGTLTINWAGGSVTVSVSQNGVGARCDVNHDGAINTADVNLIVQAALSATYDPLYDLDRDGRVTVNDAQLEVNITLGTGVCPP
jgi:hypothetical protein